MPLLLYTAPLAPHLCFSLMEPTVLEAPLAALIQDTLKTLPQEAVKSATPRVLPALDHSLLTVLPAVLLLLWFNHLHPAL